MEYDPIKHYIVIDGRTVQVLDRPPTPEEMANWPDAEKAIYQEYPPFVQDYLKGTGNVPKRCVAGWTGKIDHPHRLPIFVGYKDFKKRVGDDISDGICEYCVGTLKNNIREYFNKTVKEGKENRTFEEFFNENIGKILQENYKKLKVK